MEHIYHTLFVVGVSYAVIAAILGGVLDVFDIDGDIDMEGDIPWLNLFRPITVFSFITVLGGIGMLGTRGGFHPVLTASVAIIIAGLVAYLLQRFVVIPLHKAQNTSAPTEDDLKGLQATVISTIYENGYGSIAYSYKGNRYNSPAKHLNNQHVAKGEKVVICDIRDKVYYVVPLSESPELSDS